MADLQALKQDSIQAFNHAAEDKHYLEPEDYKVAVLELLGYKPSKYEVSTVWKTHVLETQNGDPSTVSAEGMISSSPRGMEQSTFLSIMTERLRRKDHNELIRQIFVAFDVHLHGFITTTDCRHAFKQVVPHIQDDLIESWFREVDADGDGRVTYRDFELMMKSYQYLFSQADLQ